MSCIKLIAVIKRLELFAQYNKKNETTLFFHQCYSFLQEKVNITLQETSDPQKFVAIQFTDNDCDSTLSVFR